MALAEFLTEGALPLLLIFVTTFAILQRSKILGEDKTQIDAIVSLAIGLILVLTPITRELVNNIIPWLGVGLAALLLFFILFGFVEGDLTKGDDEYGEKHKRVRIVRRTLLGIISLFVVLVIIFTTGLDDIILNAAEGIGGSIGEEFLSYLLMALIIIGAVTVALYQGKKNNRNQENK